MVVRRKQHKMQADSRTRPAAVAGLFYPSDGDLLRTQVLDLLADFAAPPKVMPKALIAPHAGYVYSGCVAATAFATLRDSAQAITRVVLIGPAHYLHEHGIAAPTVDAFETPLGRVPIDAEALRIYASGLMRRNEEPRAKRAFASAPDCVGHQGGARADLTLSNFGMIGGRFAST